MRKITTITVSLAMLLIVAISGITAISRKTTVLRKELNGIEFRIMDLKNGEESAEKQANMTIVNKGILKQAITL